MTPRPCLSCGVLTPTGSRCPACRAQRERVRGNRQQRGYDRDHDAERARWAPLVDSGAVACARCGQPILPGSPWDLDHDATRTSWLGPSHAACNRAAAGRA